MAMALRPQAWARLRKAVIAKGGVDVTTNSTFSEAAFLGSPIYIRHLHLTTAMDAVNALKVIDGYAGIPIRLIDPSLQQSVQLCRQLNVYAYDAYVMRARSISEPQSSAWITS